LSSELERKESEFIFHLNFVYFVKAEADFYRIKISTRLRAGGGVMAGMETLQ
jgi:hypothetical protein